MEPFSRLIVDEVILTEAYGQHEPANRPSTQEAIDTSVDTERGEHAPRPLRRRLMLGTQLNEQGIRVRKYFDAEVSTDHADILMLLCCLISGFIDSTTYDAYGTFVSMQTGNTIFIGLGSFTGHSITEPRGWVKSVVSIASFVLGCYFFSRLHRLFRPLRRSTLISSFLLQSVFVLVTASLIQADAVNGSAIRSDTDWEQELSIAILSFQSAGQIVGSRVLSLGEIPSVVITSVLCDLVSDPQLLGGWSSNVKRNRRTLAFLGILVGAAAGGWITTKTGRIQGSLRVAGGLKVLVTVAWVVWPEKVKS